MGKGIAKQCRHIKLGGIRCRANTRNGSQFCFFHDPKSAAARAAARKAGGIQRSRKAAVLPPDTPDKPLASLADVIGLLAETINEVRRGEVDPRISNAVGYLAGILLKARSRAELEERVARLELIVAGQQANPTPEFDLDADRETVEFVNPGDGGRP
jgi:hypothetical protein